MIPSLETLLMAGCILGLGVNLWVLWKHLLAVDIPPAISHPVKFRILHVLMQLTIAWVNFPFYSLCPARVDPRASGSIIGDRKEAFEKSSRF